MLVHVLLFDAGSDAEGIHSLEMSGRTVVLLFENPDDAQRYAGLLEAQDFPVPTVEAFCGQSGYEARFIEAGFVPESDEERLFMAPPESNRDVTTWKDDEQVSPSQDSEKESAPGESAELDALRQRLEGLL